MDWERAAELLRIDLGNSAGSQVRESAADDPAPLMVRPVPPSALAGHTAWIHAPKLASKSGGTPLPLIMVMHGAGKNRGWDLDSRVRSWAELCEKHNVIVLYPEALDHTWDFITTRGSSRADIDFIQEAITSVCQHFSVDNKRIGVVGISDGGSMCLSLATQNPTVFQAAMSSSAGFCVPPPPAAGASPMLYVQHGSEDSMFPIEHVGMRVRDELKEAGYSVHFKVAEGQGHVPDGWGEEFIPAWLALSKSSL